MKLTTLEIFHLELKLLSSASHQLVKRLPMEQLLKMEPLQSASLRLIVELLLKATKELHLSASLHLSQQLWYSNQSASLHLVIGRLLLELLSTMEPHQSAFLKLDVRLPMELLLKAMITLHLSVVRLLKMELQLRWATLE